jgi:hypothetical protein
MSSSSRSEISKFDLATQIGAHGTDDPASDASSLGRRAFDFSNTVVFDDQLGLLAGRPDEPDTDFSNFIRISIFESICDKFGNHHAKVDADVIFKLD